MQKYIYIYYILYILYIIHMFFLNLGDFKMSYIYIWYHRLRSVDQIIVRPDLFQNYWVEKTFPMLTQRWYNEVIWGVWNLGMLHWVFHAMRYMNILYCVYHVCICRHRNEEDRHSHPLELDDASWELRPALSVFFNISRQTKNGSQLVSWPYYETYCRWKKSCNRWGW